MSRSTGKERNGNCMKVRMYEVLRVEERESRFVTTDEREERGEEASFIT